MKKHVFEGAGVAIVTPFNEDMSINYKSFERLIEFQLQGETDAIIVCGTTGESSTLSDGEHLSAIKFVVETVNGAVPVIAGTGSNDTKYASWLSKEAQKLGADAVLLVTPYYNKTTQEGLKKHFKTIADSIDIPAILYNVPSRTGMTIDVSTLKQLAEVPNIVAIKEASGNIGYCAKIMAECGDELAVYSGNDDMTVPIMSLGGLGVISVLSNILPFVTHMMAVECLTNHFDTAKSIQLRYLDIINALFCEVNPIPVKEALNMMGFNVGKCRLPLASMSENDVALLKSTMWKHGLVL